MTSAFNQIPYGAPPPDSWRVVPLKHLAKLHNGYVFKSDGWTDSGTPIIRIENLNGSESFNRSNLALNEKHHVSAGDLLFSWSGNPGTSFGPFRWNEPGLYFLNQHIFKVSVEGCDKNWLYWSLRAATYWIERELTSGMIGMVHVTKEELSNVPIPIPPVDEQLRIVEFLDAETARIDRMTSARERQIAVLDECEYAQVTDELIPGSLTSPAGEWPWAWLPAPVDDAPLVRLGYIARLQSGLTIDGKRDLSGDVVTRPYLRVANVQADRINVDNVSNITVPANIADRSTLLAGDVLMTEGGDLDKLGRGTVWRGELEECLHQNHVFAVRPDGPRLDADYLSLMTRTVHGRCYFESTGVKTTNLASTNSGKILGFPIPLPSLKVQRLRVQAVQRKLNECARAKQRLRAQLQLLAERRQALIIAAVTGHLDVTTARPAHDRNL
ncbi:restriction endonuclease subunit S [Streptomyces sp. NPDC058576]|uniref:restriction endonuclease subunit S n=1 Tax=Streptomyces sp. NPDC058576 TaxID=3346547 RepID=UPI00365D8B57